MATGSLSAENTSWRDTGTIRRSCRLYRHDLDLDIRVLDRRHPVTRDMEDFTIRDEGYSNLWIREGVKPLLKTGHPDCSDTVGWVNRFGQSDVVYLIFGHDSRAYASGSFRQLLENALNWLTDTSRA